MPAQTAPAGDAAIDRLAGKTGLTTIVMELQVAGFPAEQVSLELSSQITISPLTGG